MKHFFFLFCTLCCLSSTAWSQASATLQSMISAQDVRSVALNLNAKRIEIKETKGSRIMVETRIALGTPSDHLLKYLIEGGRYDLVQELDPVTGQLRLSRKPNLNVLIIKGKECNEDLEFIVYLPANVKFAAGVDETALNR